jgi:hypothetical protein
MDKILDRSVNRNLDFANPAQEYRSSAVQEEGLLITMNSDPFFNSAPPELLQLLYSRNS